MTHKTYNPFYSNSWAVVVGINDYQSVGTLSYATHDAEAIHDLLVNQLNFTQENIYLLLNEEATRANILGALSNIREKSIEDDRFLFFFAGHGHTLEGARGPVGFLIPTEGVAENLDSLIYFDDLVRTSELILAKHALFIMDVCYGGVIFTRRIPPGTQRFMRDMLQRYSRQAITAGKADEAVADGGGPGGLNSIFTGHLIEGISGRAANSEGVISASRLMHYVYENVGSDTRSQQTPHYGFLDGDGDFILQSPNKEHLLSDSANNFLITFPPQPIESEVEITETKTQPSFHIIEGYVESNDPNFGRNIWSRKLGEIRRDANSRGVLTPAYSWISFIAEPTTYGFSELDIAKELDRLPSPKPEDSPPFTRFAIPVYKQTTIDTAHKFEQFHQNNDLWQSYLRIDKNGNIEYAESHNVFTEFKGIRLFRFVTLIGLIWQFQYLTKEIFESNGYNSGVRLLVNLVGTRDTILAEFSNSPGEGGKIWLEPFRNGWLGENPQLLKLKCPNTNLQLVYEFDISKQDDDSLKQLVINIAEQLTLAYNHQSKPRCFNYNTYEFPWNQFFSSRSYRQ